MRRRPRPSRRTFAAALCGFPLLAAEAPKPALRVTLGPEQLIASDVPWPYLFQSREGSTVIFGHVRWPPGGKYPIHFTTRSFDERKTWQEWRPGAEHVGNKYFEASYWVSSDALRTLQGPHKYSFVLPQAEVSSFDDRGEPVSRMYVRRSILELPNGDLLAPAYGHFETDKMPTEY